MGGVVLVSSPSPLPSGGGLPHPLPRAQDPGWRESLGILIATFLPISLLFFFCIVFRCLFGSILAPVSLPTCLPKSTKIQEKSMPRCHPSWTPFFDRFLVGFGSQLPPPDLDFSSPRCSGSTNYQKSPFEFNIDF